MYVLFGFLLLFLTSVYGHMIQCFVGGIINYDTHNEDITKMQEEYCYTLVKAIEPYVWNDILNIPLDLVNNDLPSKITVNADFQPIQNADEFYTNYTKEFHETYSMKLLHTDKSIVEYWDEIVEIGTDIHILKFHSKLLDMHRKQHTFTPEELLVYFKSSYSAVGIYYLTNNILVARSVSRETAHIYDHYRDILKGNYWINIMEIAIWEFLTFTAQIEFEDFNNRSDEYRIDLINRVKKVEKYIKLLLAHGENYTCSFVFFFRGVLLDRHIVSDNSQLKDFASLIKADSIEYCDNHANNNKYQLYINIILSIYDPDIEFIKGLTSFYHLFNALKIPVFTSEDRLLNYKVTTMAMKKISDCVNRNVEWLEYENDCLCNTLKANRQYDTDLDIILTKLTHMQVYQMTNDESELIPDYRNMDGTIDENKLHMIVTMSLDNMDNNFDLSSKRIKIVKTTIKSLKEYVATLEATEIKEYSKELMRAHKWLAELRGVLCTDPENELELKKHQEKLEASLIRAITLQKEHVFDDDHLEFLFYKKICKDSQMSYSWERNYKADGWIQKLPSDSDENSNDSIFQGYECDRVYAFLSINNRFIHKADINILLFKHLMKTYYNDDSITKFVKNALSHWVVTSEDRVRNLQAHELYSMYFVWRNYRIAKEKEKK